MATDKELTALLWSLKEDAEWAWKRAMEGDEDDAMRELGRTWKQLEQYVIAHDALMVRR